MNKQLKLNPDGTVKSRGIEWTDATHNPISGCFHACQWEMPDGKVANCYAEDVADNVARRAYPQGFEHHYWKPSILDEPLKLTEPAKIFVGSMADNLGHWVPDEQIQALIDMCRKADWHTFQWLTKNPVRAKQFDFPDNCWIGTSSPPDFMWNKRLSEQQRERLLFRALDSLSELEVAVRWMSIEPLSYDIASLFQKWVDASKKRLPLEWAVIGAASNGPTYYQPEPDHLVNVLRFLDEHGVKVFFKGNLRPSMDKGVIAYWREDFPAPSPSPTPPTKPTTVVNFRDVKDHWDGNNQKWDSDEYVYIGRYNRSYALGESMWANPFRFRSDSIHEIEYVVNRYREYINAKLLTDTDMQLALPSLRGKTLVCWCKQEDKEIPCHGDVLLELLGEEPVIAEAKAQPVEQLTLF